MNVATLKIEANKAYIMPIGDLHIGDKAFEKFGRSHLLKHLHWIKEHPTARIFLCGDIFNVASRTSKTSQADSLSLGEEKDIGFDLFYPYRKQIIGAIDGNHEERMLNDYGDSPTKDLCRALGVPYFQYSAIVIVKVGKRTDVKGAWRQVYRTYFHHTTGGGGTIGGKLNRVKKLDEIVEGCDVYFGAHSHQEAIGTQDVYTVSLQKGIKLRRKWYVNTGSYLYHEGSYAERKMLPPVKLGSPRVMFTGNKKRNIQILL